MSTPLYRWDERAGRLVANTASPEGLSQSRKRAVHSGDEGEALIRTLNEACEDAGIAKIRKLPTPFRIIGRNKDGTLKCVHTERSGVDFVGVMLDGSSRGVFAEIKRTTKRRFGLDAIKEHQRAELDIAASAGAVAVLVVVQGDTIVTATVHAVPWSDVQSVLAAGAKSLGPDDLAPYRVPRNEPWLRRFVRVQEDA